METRSQAEAIRVYTMSKQLGEDAQLAATEIVRRAERGIGIAVRRGQQNGELPRNGDHGPVREPYNRIRNGVTETVRPTQSAVPAEKRRSVKEFFRGGSDLTQTYAVTDGVSDEQFDAALAEAKASGALVLRSDGEGWLQRQGNRHTAVLTGDRPMQPQG